MPELTAAVVVETAKRILDAADYSFFCTVPIGPSPGARLVQHFKPTADLVVHVGTSPTSRKVQELRAYPEVTLACQHPALPAYCVLRGICDVHDDLEIRGRYWRDFWVAFWPEGPHATDYAVLQVHPTRVEVMDLSQGEQQVAPPPFGLITATVERTRDGWQLVAAA